MESVITYNKILLSLMFLIISIPATPSSSSSDHVQGQLPTPSGGCPIDTLTTFTCTRSEPSECNTFAVLRTNTFYSSLFNLTHYLNLDGQLISTTNGFSSETEFLILNQPLLIPITCRCSSVTGLFEAKLVRTAVTGETLSTISSSLEGLTSCTSIAKNNPSLSPTQPLGDRTQVSVPLRCACPTASELKSGRKLLVSYPVKDKDSISSLALEFNTTSEAIVSVNKNQQQLVPGSTILIPLAENPSLGSLAKPQQPWLKFPNAGGKANQHHQKEKIKKKKMSKVSQVCMAVIVVAVMSILAVSVAVGMLVYFRRKRRMEEHEVQMNKKSSSIGKKMRRNKNNKKKRNVMKPMMNEDVELQKLNLSIRTTSEKKVSFEGSTISTYDTSDTTPHKASLEIYTVTDLARATANFDDHNHVDGTVYHGRLKGKDMAIKRVTSDIVTKVDYGLFQDLVHSHHPNVIRLLGTCLEDGIDNSNDLNSTSSSFLVFEYAKNGTLKDWIHGGLAVKSHFIASCYCFLNWKQRLRICLDIGLALRYMHEVVIPPYVHRNVKSRNVFLDEEFHGKIGNFGMARCTGDDNNNKDVEFHPSNPVSWNRGYFAPELVNTTCSFVSPATDIYAFGVVLLEVLTGKTPLIINGGDEEHPIVLLADAIKTVVGTGNDKNDALRGWIDSALGENYKWEEAVNLARIARLCVEEDPSMRPTSGWIVGELLMMVEEENETTAAAGSGSCSRDETGELVHESSSKPLVMAAVREGYCESHDDDD